MTFAEYLAQDDSLLGRHEFVDGQVYAMASPTNAHHAISFNIAAGIHRAAGASRCRVYHQGFTLRTPRDNAYLPDVMVACGAPIGGDALYLTDPCLVVEVLSPSTARTDVGEKLLAYQEIPSLQAYWIVEATWRGVERHWRDVDGAWRVESLRGEGSIAVPCLATAVTLDQLYEGVDVPSEPPRPHLRRVREPDEAYTLDEGTAHVPEYAD